MSIILTVPCFHDPETNPNDNIDYCQFVIKENNLKFHVIYLKNDIHMSNLQHFKSVHYHFIKSEYVDEIWEEISCLPLNTLFSIEQTSDVYQVLDLTKQLLQSLCILSQQELYYDNLIKSKQYDKFLDSNAVFNYDEKMRYIQLNRFQIKNAKLINHKSKKVKLLKQLHVIPILIQTMFFIKRNNHQSIIKCSDQCKLNSFNSRFNNLDDHLINKLHEVFCDKSQNLSQIFLNLEYLYPDEKINILETYNHLLNL
ncbi:CmNV_090-like protein [Aratus pisonii nudivirus]|nr:CmNV_090-like protein [Aratus pisonii nudivirus]